MTPVVVRTTSFAQELNERLSREMELLRRQGVKVEIGSWQIGSDTFFACRTRGGSRQYEEIFRYHVANALTAAILHKLEPAWIYSRLRRRHKCLNREEAEKVIQQAITLLHESDTAGGELPRQRILIDLMLYLDRHPAVHLEGFFRFRLQAYQKQIDQVITESIQWLQKQKEEEQLLDLLKYFLSTQEPQIEYVEIFLKRTGLFRLMDRHHNSIENDYLEEFVADVVEGHIDYADLLISVMITLAPQKVRCHFECSLPVIDTLGRIFGERISFCRSCDACRIPAGAGDKTGGLFSKNSNNPAGR
ncbi:MAG TPA: hypothetical protein GXX29_04225 [Firmicutes bacterium]|nr:hypothetical protein [Bacillota bacterium]